MVDYIYIGFFFLGMELGRGGEDAAENRLMKCIFFLNEFSLHLQEGFLFFQSQFYKRIKLKFLRWPSQKKVFAHEKRGMVQVHAWQFQIKFGKVEKMVSLFLTRTLSKLEKFILKERDLKRTLNCQQNRVEKINKRQYL